MTAIRARACDDPLLCEPAQRADIDDPHDGALSGAAVCDDLNMAMDYKVVLDSDEVLRTSTLQLRARLHMTMVSTV